MEKNIYNLSIAMKVYGIFLPIAVTTFAWWPEVGRWPPYHPVYERMFIAIFFAWGICLLNGSYNPRENLGLVDFTSLQGIFHGSVMAVDTILGNGGHHGFWHFIGDVFLHLSAPIVLIPLRIRVEPIQIYLHKSILVVIILYSFLLVYLGFFLL